MIKYYQIQLDSCQNPALASFTLLLQLPSLCSDILLTEIILQNFIVDTIYNNIATITHMDWRWLH